MLLPPCMHCNTSRKHATADPCSHCKPIPILEARQQEVVFLNAEAGNCILKILFTHQFGRV